LIGVEYYLDTLDFLYHALEEKINSQLFYNELSVKVVNPVARELFKRLRDEEMANVMLLQREVTTIEAKQSPVHKIIPRLKV